jgi:hypothetical protein
MLLKKLVVRKFSTTREPGSDESLLWLEVKLRHRYFWKFIQI